MSNLKGFAMQALMMQALAESVGGGLFGSGRNVFDTDITYVPEKRVAHPWDKVNLSKSERKGKTYEELQELRKQIWEKLNPPEPPKPEPEDMNQSETAKEIGETIKALQDEGKIPQNVKVIQAPKRKIIVI